jgi:3-methyladenine DNA glycosylase/8-oxoguanine DNA glycosylase
VTASLEIEVRPPWPYRLSGGGGGDGVGRVRAGVSTRLLRFGDERVVVAAWQRRGGEVRLRATASPDAPNPPAKVLEAAIERMRFALAVDDDLSEFHRAFRHDPVIGPAISRRPWHRPRRRPFAWEALAWSITKQLIESGRAAQIERRMVRCWGDSATSPFPPGWTLRDVPDAATIAERSPAELAATDLSAGRALAMIRVAREVAAGRADPADPADDPRFRRIREIGPWTMQCLGLYGRAEPDSLPAGDLGYIKLVGRLAGLGRRATVEEVEEYFAPYEPFRGLAGEFALRHYHAGVRKAPPARLAAR